MLHKPKTVITDNFFLIDPITAVYQRREASSEVLNMPSTSQGFELTEGIRTDSPIKNIQQVVSSIQKFEFPHNFEVESFKTMGISIQMDFSETLGEIPISSTILENLRNFFQTEESLNLKVIISDLSKSYKN